MSDCSLENPLSFLQFGDSRFLWKDTIVEEGNNPGHSFPGIKCHQSGPDRGERESSGRLRTSSRAWMRHIGWSRTELIQNSFPRDGTPSHIQHRSRSQPKSSRLHVQWLSDLSLCWISRVNVEWDSMLCGLRGITHSCLEECIGQQRKTVFFSEQPWGSLDVRAGARERCLLYCVYFK